MEVTEAECCQILGNPPRSNLENRFAHCHHRIRLCFAANLILHGETILENGKIFSTRLTLAMEGALLVSGNVFQYRCHHPSCIP